MLTLNLNHNKMGMRPRGETWEWYTIGIGSIGAIHVHNDTKSGKWVYIIRTAYDLNSRQEYDTKELAYTAAKRVFSRLATEAIGLLDNK